MGLMVKTSLDQDSVESGDVNGKFLLFFHRVPEFVYFQVYSGNMAMPGVLYVTIEILSEVVQLKSLVSYKNPQ